MSVGPSPQQSPIFKQYRLLVSDTARQSDRRQTTNNYFVAANAGLLAGIGVLIGQNSVESFLGFVMTLVVAMAGLIVCRAWLDIIEHYRKLVNLRIKMLEHLEQRPDFPGPINTYRLEHLVLYGPQAKDVNKVDVDEALIQAAKQDLAGGGGSGRGLTSIEKSLPNVLRIIYRVIIAAAVIAALVLNYHPFASSVNALLSPLGISIPK